MCLQFSMQEGDILEHTNAKCYMCTLESTCIPLCITHDTIEHTHAKILVRCTLERSVSSSDTNDEVVDN